MWQPQQVCQGPAAPSRMVVGAMGSKPYLRFKPGSGVCHGSQHWLSVHIASFGEVLQSPAGCQASFHGQRSDWAFRMISWQGMGQRRPAGGWGR
jgi:hypothetical protein